MHRQNTPLAVTGRWRFAATLVMGAIMLAGPLAVPASADGPYRHRFEGRGPWQEHGRRGEHWRPENRYNGYYSAPPVIYVPPSYYQQPGVSLNFSFPLVR